MARPSRDFPASGLNGAAVTEWKSAEFRVNYLTPGQIVFPDANAKLTGSSALFWDNTNIFLHVGDTPNQVIAERLNVTKTYSTGFTSQGAAFYLRVNGNPGATQMTVAQGAMATDFVFTGSGGATDDLRGITANVYSQSTGSMGFVLPFVGVARIQEVGSPTATASFQGATVVSAAATVGHQYTFWAESPVLSGGGAITQAVGFYAQVQSVAGVTTGLAFLQDGTGDQNWFLGTSGFGSSSPRRRVDILDASNPQFRLTQADNSKYIEVRVDSSSNCAHISASTTAYFSFNNAVRIGTATDTSAQGDLVAGLTGAARMFYQQSTSTVLYYNSSNAKTAQVGAWPFSMAYAFFGNGNISQSVAGNYALCQSSTGQTLLNAASGQNMNLRINNADVLILGGSSFQVQSGISIGYFGHAVAAQQTRGATFTNNITSGGTTDSSANWTDLATYSNDAAAIRNLARVLVQYDTALRAYGLLT